MKKPNSAQYGYLGFSKFWDFDPTNSKNSLFLISPKPKFKKKIKNGAICWRPACGKST